MKSYIVPEEFLQTYKELANNFSNHNINCEINKCDICTCGLSTLKRKLRYLDKNIKEYEEILDA
jgi:hypothetical protein